MNLAERVPDPIDADRVVLNPLRVSDAEEMVAVLSSPDLYVYIGGEPPTLDSLRRRYVYIGGEPPTLDSLRRRYSDMVVGQSPDGEQEWLNWTVRLKDSDGPAVGTVQATVTQEGGRAEVAWIIDADRQGQGYGSEAAAAMVHALIEAGVPWVTAHVHPEHEASVRVARACQLTPTEEFQDGERRWVWRREGSP